MMLDEGLRNYWEQLVAAIAVVNNNVEQGVLSQAALMRAQGNSQLLTNHQLGSGQINFS